MIKREHIKQAIDALSGRDPEIGHTLDEMLGTGRIDAVSHDIETDRGGDFHFLFENEEVRVKRISYFKDGTVPIEQRLLIKYGELVKRQELLENKGGRSYRGIDREIRMAGLKLMVIHEIDHAVKRLKRRYQISEAEGIHSMESTDIVYRDLITSLEKIKQDKRALDIIPNEIDSAVMYQGLVGDATPAYFMNFPFCMEAMIQVAEINLEFFHVRFLLNCLMRGTEKNLFACIADRRIVGIAYLTFKERLLYNAIEIQYIATESGKPAYQTEPGAGTIKGVGTFLVAGVWMLWKTHLRAYKDILLDSEVEARQFYESVGFHSRGHVGFILKDLKAHLVRAILMIANNCRNLREDVLEEISAIIHTKVKGLRKKPGSDQAKRERERVIACVKECLKSGAHPVFAETAVRALIKYRKKIPESKELLQFGLEKGSDETKAYIINAADTRS